MIAHTLLPEFDHEMKTTRSLLERVPDADATWKPHDKSMSLGDLSAHVANLLMWAIWTVEAPEFDLNPPGKPAFVSPRFESRAKLLETFDENVQMARRAIESASDEAMKAPWTLKRAGQTLFTMPRVAVLRSFFMNHIIHHRGQLSVYLRLRDVPLPSIYGPTADERLV